MTGTSASRKTVEISNLSKDGIRHKRNVGSGTGFLTSSSLFTSFLSDFLDKIEKKNWPIIQRKKNHDALF